MRGRRVTGWLKAAKENEQRAPALRAIAEAIRVRMPESGAVSDTGVGSVRFLALVGDQAVEIEVLPISRERWEAAKAARVVSVEVQA